MVSTIRKLLPCWCPCQQFPSSWWVLWLVYCRHMNCTSVMTIVPLLPSMCSPFTIEHCLFFSLQATGGESVIGTSSSSVSISKSNATTQYDRYFGVTRRRISTLILPDARTIFLYCSSCLVRRITLPLETKHQNSCRYAIEPPCPEAVIAAVWRCDLILSIPRIRYQGHPGFVVIPPRATPLQISASHIFPTPLCSYI